MEVEVEESPAGDSERWLERDSWGAELEDPTPVLEAIWWQLPEEYEPILEPGRIRLVPLATARAFWRAWWKDSGPTVK